MIEPKKTRTTAAKHASIAAFRLVESFLLSLVDARDDGRVLLSLDDARTPSNPITGDMPVITIRYMLLNPAERFRDLVDQARSIVLAGGTMEPISDFLKQLFPAIPKDRISTLSCKHVIPKKNLLTQVVGVGPRKVEFEFKFANRGDDGIVSGSPMWLLSHDQCREVEADVQLTELGAVLLSIIALVPDGMVVFLPSYAFLDKVKAFWIQSGLLRKLDDKKQVSWLVHLLDSCS